MLTKFLKFYGEKFSKFLQEDGWLVLLLITLNLTPLIQKIFLLFTDEVTDIEQIKFPFLDQLITNYFGATVILLFCVLMYCCLSNFPRTKFFLQILILIGFSVSFVVDLFVIYSYKITLIMHFIEVLIATNLNEAKEFLKFYVFKPEIFFLLTAFILLIVAAVKNLRRIFQNMSEENLKRFSYYTLIILLPAAFGLCSIVGNAVYTSSYLGTILVRNIRNTYIATQIAGSEPEIWATMDSQNEKIISDNSKIPYVVFILGESATRNHMQIYGYNLETTPFAVERYKRGELFKFNDVIACANATSTAMKLLFNFTEKEVELENWYKTPNIFDIARRAGYHTGWISNQSPIGWYGNIDKIYSERCDEKYFADVDFDKVEEKDKLFSRNFDIVLLPAIEDFISHSQEKNFYCVHLYGSHVEYRERYPAEFAKFTAADENKISDESKKVTAEYDNSILYTDFILNEIFKRFEDKNALIIYISDHGQEVYESGKNNAGTTPEEDESRSMIEIPMLVWTSQKFREMYPEKISALKNAENNHYRTDLLIHTILDLMDIQTESFNPTKSIINEKFDKFRIRIYNNKPYIRD